MSISEISSSDVESLDLALLCKESEKYTLLARSKARNIDFDSFLGGLSGLLPSLLFRSRPSFNFEVNPSLPQHDDDGFKHPPHPNWPDYRINDRPSPFRTSQKEFSRREAEAVNTAVVFGVVPLIIGLAISLFTSSDTKRRKADEKKNDKKNPHSDRSYLYPNPYGVSQKESSLRKAHAIKTNAALILVPATLLTILFGIFSSPDKEKDDGFRHPPHPNWPDYRINNKPSPFRSR